MTKVYESDPKIVNEATQQERHYGEPFDYTIVEIKIRNCKFDPINYRTRNQDNYMNILTP